MLVLGRRKDEGVVIETPQGKIQILIARIGVDQVRIGIEAPNEFKILRNEIAYYGVLDAIPEPSPTLKVVSDD